MTLLLLRCRARMAWTLLKPGSRKDWGYRILIAVLALIYSPVLVMSFWAIRVLSGTVAETLGIEILHRLLYLPAAGFGFFLMFLVLNRVHSVLFESSDAELLRSLPVTAQRLTRARLTVLAVLLSPLLLLFLPLTVFYGIEASAPPAYYAVAVFLLAFFGLTILGVGALGTCLLALTIPARGLRGLSKYGTLVILLPSGMAAGMLMPMVRQVNDMMDQVLEVADYVAVGPIAWLVDGLGHAAAGESGMAAVLPAVALLASAGGSWGACLALAPRLSRRDVAESAPATAGTLSGIGWWAPDWLDGASRALWRRELNAVRAEAAKTLLMPIAMIVFFAIMSRITTNVLPLPMLIGIMAISMVPGLTMMAVGQEGRAFWIIRSLPIPMWKVLAVKLVVRSAVGGVALAGLAASGYILFTVSADGGSDTGGLASILPFALSPSLVPWAVAMVLLSLVIGGMWGLATGARFPRFTPSRKGQYIGVGASMCGTFGAMTIVATLVLSLVPLQIDALRPVLWFLPFAVLAFWIGASLLYLAWAAWHLERLEQ